jgi:hypothetical protein
MFKPPSRHGFCLLAAFALLLGGPVFSSLAQAPEGQVLPGLQPPSNSEPSYALTGTVINSMTGEPVRRALVQVLTGSQPSALTDGDGHFEFDEVLGTRVSVTARKPGFFTDQAINRMSPEAKSVTLGPDAPPLVLRLIPESLIFGRIQSPDGEPIEGLPVKVMCVHVVEGRKSRQANGITTTDEDGEFRVANLPAGSYVMEAGPSADWRLLGRAADNAHHQGYAAVFYGGAREIASATPIRLAAGQHAQADFSLKPEPLYRVTGLVTGPAVNGEVNLRFVNSSGEPFEFETQFDAATGKFQAKLPAGSYTVTAQSEAEGGTALGAELPFTVHADLTGLRIALAPATSISVRETLESSTPVPGGNGRFQPATVRLGDISAARDGAQLWAAYGNSGSDAGLAVRNVPPGRYSAEVTSNGSQWYVQSVECGGKDLLREDLVVTGGAQVPEIEIVLREGSAGLHGTVSSSGAQATALLIPEGPPGQTRAVSTNPQGEFDFDRIPPGNYSVLAFEGEGPEYKDPDVLSTYLSKATHLGLRPNEKATVTLDLIPLVK